MRTGLVTRDVLLLLTRPSFPVRRIGVLIADERASPPGLVWRFHPDADISEPGGPRREHAGPFHDQRQRGVDRMSFGGLGLVPVPPLPHSDQAAGVRDQNVVAHHPRTLIESVPPRIEGIERDHLNATSARPVRDEPPSQGGFSRAALSVDHDDLIRRIHRFDGGDDRCESAPQRDREGIAGRWISA